MRKGLVLLIFVLSFFVGACGEEDDCEGWPIEERDDFVEDCVDASGEKNRDYCDCTLDYLKGVSCVSGEVSMDQIGDAQNACIHLYKDLTSCKTTADCIRSQYCDLENPQESPITGAVSYFCKDRPRCIKESDCPIYWRCLEDEGFCITDKEAEGFLCKSDEECVFSPNTKCNLGTGRCYNPDAVNTRNTVNAEDIGDTDHSGFFGDKDE